MILYEVKRVVSYLESGDTVEVYAAKKVKHYVKRLGKYNEYISKDELYTIVGVGVGREVAANVVGTMDAASAQLIEKSFKK